MGRHHQQHSRRGSYVAHLALGAATVAGMLGGGGVAVALQAAPAPVVPAFPTTAPAAVAPVVAPVPTTTEAARPSSKTPAKTTTKKTTTKKPTTKKPAPVCDLSGPPEFGDPAHPNVITNRNCGYVDSRGRERSRDRWIDDQLLDAAAH
ncbi:hypothetical protein [Actinomycetospora atypica]|uniref:Uncharacterized protein n=1 Tax=Actinomycetospora atypica TaxID=1290095 RepID=A0ABV9YIC0_9PSEU